MGVIVTPHIKGSAAARLSVSTGEYLEYTLSPTTAPHNAIFDFVCDHHRVMLQVKNSVVPDFHWYVGAGPPTPGLTFPIDAAPGEMDIYVVGLYFLQCPSYRLQVVQYPQGVLLKDTSYLAQSTQDHWQESLAIVAR
jgi:hypothetical protein